jgi:lysozyme
MTFLPETEIKFRRLMVRDEGYSVYPYSDAVGKITIGIGYNLSDRGISPQWIEEQFSNDAKFFYHSLSQDFPWFSKLTEDRQLILVNMAFMGYKTLCNFTKMLQALENEDYKAAAREMLASRWAQQVGQRAVRLADGMVKGELEWDF